jgi:hypothetical protein
VFIVGACVLIRSSGLVLNHGADKQGKNMPKGWIRAFSLVFGLSGGRMREAVDAAYNNIATRIN